MLLAWLKKSLNMLAPLTASLNTVTFAPLAHSRRSAWLYVPSPPVPQKEEPWSSPVDQLRETLSP